MREDSGASGGLSVQFIAIDPSATPQAARGPRTSTQASAMPAAGKSGVA